MKNLSKSVLLLTLFLVSYVSFANDKNKDQTAISAQAKSFSQAFVDGDIDTIMSIYSPNARIVDVNEKIESNIGAIRKFWAPNDASKWKLISHKATSEELVVEGNMASDIGYYAGVSQHIDGRKVKFGGAYVIVWRKIDGVWRMHLDMWNDIKVDES